jgi:hypothetical protein
VEAFPTGVIEALRISGKMFFREAARFFYVFLGENLSCKICLDDVLQAGELRVIEKAAARANVGIDKARVGRILPPVRELIAVGVEDRIESQRLNGDLPKLRKAQKAETYKSRASWPPEGGRYSWMLSLRQEQHCNP